MAPEPGAPLTSMLLTMTAASKEPVKRPAADTTPLMRMVGVAQGMQLLSRTLIPTAGTTIFS